jgi:hypothetical protein
MDEPRCLWCERPFRARHSGGSPQRFCCVTHRQAFWSALRRWAQRAVAGGVLTVGQIRTGDPAACTLPRRMISPGPLPGDAKIITGHS